MRSHANGQKAQKCFYSCTGFYLQGHAVCSERLRLPIEVVEQAILTALERDVLNPSVVAKALTKAIDQLQHDREDRDQRWALLTKELHSIETELARFTHAIASGGSIPTIVLVIQEREARLQTVRGELAMLDGTQIQRFDAG